MCYCVFHGNTNTPALTVDKTTGLFLCFSPSCDRSGNLLDLVRTVTGKNEFESFRLIMKYKNDSENNLAARIKSILHKEDPMPTFSREVLKKMHAEFWESELAQEYMRSRGFSDETLETFKVGYSLRKNMIAVPMYDVDGIPVGIIGRTPSAIDKRFKNSVNLPKARTAWNIHRAKRHGNVVIIAEASYDAMRIHQAGFPNVVALLGGFISEHHTRQLSKYFDTVIIFTDMDKKKYSPNCRKCGYLECQGHRAGRDLGRGIVEALPDKKILWACYSDEEITPGWVKDACDMTDDQIRQCVWNAKSNFEYLTKHMESLAPA